MLPFNSFPGAKPPQRRPDPAQQKFAKSLLAIGHTLQSSAFTAVFVLPLTIVVSSLLAGHGPLDFLALLESLTWPAIAVLAVVYLLPLGCGAFFRQEGMKLLGLVSDHEHPVTLLRAKCDKWRRRDH